jgi:DUF4097 and DUF4098 domain-containing protein YvlB
MSNGKPRRRSIFGGLVMVVLGLLLLANNLQPELRLGSLFYQYWPVLLIIWGLAKLFDYFASRRTGESAPPTFTGGEFFLLLLILIVGGVLTAAGEFGRRVDWEGLPPWMSGTSYSYSAEAAAANVKPDSHVTIFTERGDINVIPEDISEIRVLVKKTVTTMRREEDARRRADQVQVEIASVSDGYEVRQVDRISEQGRVRVDLEVHLPRKASVEARSTRGNVHISGLAGKVLVTSRSGDTEIRDVAGSVEVQMARGDLRATDIKGNLRVTGRGSEVEIADVQGEATVEGEFSGLRFTRVRKSTRFVSQRTDLTVGELAGQLELESGNLNLTDVNGNVSLTTRNKDIRMENISGRINIQNRRGNVDLRLAQAPKLEIEVNNESGSVELSLPAKSAFEISASSRNGDVECDFAGEELKKSEDNRTQKLEGRVGASGPRIILQTTYGSVVLRKLP